LNQFSVICWEHLYFPWHFEQAIAAFVAHYSTQRYAEALGNVTPADVFFGPAAQIQDAGAALRRRTLTLRRTPPLLAHSSA
jgi:putative transposase